MQRQQLSPRQEQRQGAYLDQGTRLGVALLSKTIAEIEELVSLSLEENVFLETVDEADESMSSYFQESASGEGDLRAAGSNDAWNDGNGEQDVISELSFFDAPTYGELGSRLENKPAPEISLEDSINQQIAYVSDDPITRAIGSYIAGNLSDDGYFRMEAEDVASALAVDVQDVEAALELIRHCDPPGLGARNVRECLTAQLELLGAGNEVALRIVSDHLEDMACGRTHAIAKSLGVDLVEVQSAMDCIRSLNPRPASGYGPPDGSMYVVPEILVIREGEALEVRLRDSRLPRLAVNETYARLLRGQKMDKELAAYFEEQWRLARGLIRGIEQRRETILKIATFVVSEQQDFFRDGLRALKPITMKAVSQEMNMSHSTVSRAVSNSYMETPVGVFPLRYFFSVSAYQSKFKPVQLGWGDGEEGDGDNVSARYIKQLIKDMIDGEDKAAPLSDQALCDALAKKGYDVSRRTVNKYRSALAIPSRAKRRRIG